MFQILIRFKLLRRNTTKITILFENYLKSLKPTPEAPYWPFTPIRLNWVTAMSATVGSVYCIGKMLQTNHFLGWNLCKQISIKAEWFCLNYLSNKESFMKWLLWSECKKSIKAEMALCEIWSRPDRNDRPMLQCSKRKDSLLRMVYIILNNCTTDY